MRTAVRRYSHSASLQHLWDAVTSIRQQRQVPNKERVCSFLKRKYPEELPKFDEQLKLAIKDKLILIKTSKSNKGAKVGHEQESYRLPENENEGDGHDWYCFQCHENGEVILCSTCHRVYHEKCLSEEFLDEDDLICPICKMIENRESTNLNLDDLNLLLTFTCYRLKDKVKNVLQIQPAEEDKWRQSYVTYIKVDLLIMEMKAKDGEYQYLEEYIADAKTVCHNIVIYFGVHNPLADLARQMVRDCLHDISEIRICSNCYRMSNEKADKHWFCQPCDPPHELVYAKQKGFSFWPAKVIRKCDDIYDVRFFGGYHTRAEVEQEHIKPITSSLEQLQIKRSVTLNRALDELKRHQMLLEHGIVDAKNLTPLKRSQLATLKHPSRSKKRLISGHTSPDSGIEGGSNSSPAFKDIPEDVVTSTLESPSTNTTTTTTKVCACTQTMKETPPSCNCEVKYETLFGEFQERMEREHREDKERSLRDLAERLRQDLDDEKQKCVALALEKQRLENQMTLNQLQQDVTHAHQDQLRELIDQQKQELSQCKKRQWCYNCESEAIYHCCWNTSYCSVECQQAHWHKEHKRTCRRKR